MNVTRGGYRQVFHLTKAEPYGDFEATGLDRYNLASLVGHFQVAPRGSAGSRSSVDSLSLSQFSEMSIQPGASTIVEDGGQAEHSVALQHEEAHELFKSRSVPTELHDDEALALSACKTALGIASIEPARRAKQFDGAINAFERALGNRLPSVLERGLTDLSGKHSEIDLPHSIRLLPDTDRADGWKRVASLFRRSLLSERTLESRQQLAALLVATAYIEHAEIKNELNELLIEANLRRTSPKINQGTVMREVKKHIALISNSDERVAVLAKLLERAAAAPNGLNFELLDSLAEAIQLIPPDAQQKMRAKLNVYTYRIADAFSERHTIEPTVGSPPSQIFR